jgi:hypothetical protein
VDLMCRIACGQRLFIRGILSPVKAIVVMTVGHRKTDVGL